MSIFKEGKLQLNNIIKRLELDFLQISNQANGMK